MRTREPWPVFVRGFGAGLVLWLSSCSSTVDRHVDAFRAALERHDYETARAFLSDDPRTWWGEQSGEGSPWTLGGGRWSAWDEEFRGRGTPVRRESDPGIVRVLVEETNDYYALTERGPQVYLRTYFIDEQGKISGTLISSPPGETRDPGRAGEFDAWLADRYPDDYADLRPDGRIDPTEDRASRTRVRLVEWRREVDLPPIAAETR